MNFQNGNVPSSKRPFKNSLKLISFLAHGGGSESKFLGGQSNKSPRIEHPPIKGDSPIIKICHFLVANFSQFAKK
jgi:hypothetical protein